MKKRFHTYKKILGLLPLLLLGFFTSMQAQDVFEFKIQYMESNDSTWGVYVRPISNFAPGSNDAVTGSGQVTILMRSKNHPNGGMDSIYNIQSVNGDWNSNYDVVDGPTEAPNVKYFFIGMNDGDGITYEDGEETLLFTFQSFFGCPDTLGLINNDTDPFNALPNSVGNNPGMDLSVFNSSTGTIHNWEANYSPLAFSCADCDMDGIPDALEDYDGDGDHTNDDVNMNGLPDYCDPCYPLGISEFTATIEGGDMLTMCDEAVNTDSVPFTVTMTGGWSPFTVVYQDSNHLTTVTAIDSVVNYLSGDSIWVSPTATSTYTLVNVIDSFGCEIDVDSMFGSVLVIVEGPITKDPGGDPLNVTSCTLDTIGFGVSFSNGGDGTILYQWQESTDGGTTWSDIIDGTPYAFATTDSLVISNPAGLDGNLYRAKAYTPTCDTLYSNSASLQVDGPFVINFGPSDASICATSGHTFIGETENTGSGTLLKVWQVNDGSGWTDLSNGGFYSDVTTDSLTIANTDGTNSVAALDSNQYRIRVYSADCESTYSDSAMLVVEGLLTVDAHPVDVSVCADTVACFGVTIGNEASGNVQYQWYVSIDDGSSWTALSNDGDYSGVRSDTLCIGQPIGKDSFLYRVDVFTNLCAIVTSDSARLNVDGPILYTTDPQDEEICAGEDDVFFTSVSTIGQGLMSQRWQISRDSGVTWVDVDMSNSLYSNNSSVVAGATALAPDEYYDTLFLATSTILTMGDTMDGFQYRIVANGANGSSCKDVPSGEATLTVHGPFTITGLSNDTTICAGKPITFVVDVQNDGSGTLLYRWQKKGLLGSWNDLNPSNVHNGVTTDILSISDVSKVLNDQNIDSVYYRVKISTSECNEFFSDSVKLRVEGPFIFDDIADSPHDTTVCSGEQVFFRGNPTNYGLGEMLYEWKVSNGGGNFGPVSTDVNLMGRVTGTDSTVLVIDSATAAMDGMLFRLDVTSAACTDETHSLNALLRVDGPLTFNDQPDDIVNCSDKGVVFAVDVNNPGYGGDLSVQYRWQYLHPHTDSVWTDIKNAGVYNGASTDTLSIDLTTGLDKHKYRVIVWTADCFRDTSFEATLTEEGPVTFVDHPDDVIICSGESTSFTAISTNATGQGNETHTWQVSSNNGITWANLSYGGIYDTINTAPIRVNPGVDSSTTITTTLTISDVTGLGGNRYRAVVVSGSCDSIFSQLARLIVEGPFTITLNKTVDSVCANVSTDVTATVTNHGSGIPMLQWQYKSPDSTNFSNVPNDHIFDGITSNKLYIDSVLNHTGRLNNGTKDTLWSFDGYKFRLAVTTDTCKTEAYSDTMTLVVVSDQAGHCDWDLDGLDNDTDLDDDNDRLTDSVELYITTGPGSEPQDSVAQFDTDTDDDSISDAEEDADEDTISNGEEVDDDDGDGLADGINTSTGVFDGFPASPNPAYEDDDDVFNGDPLDPCDPILSPSCVGVVLDVNVKLQGSMNPVGRPGLINGETLMRDDLRAKDMIPLTEPYTGIKILDSLGTLVSAFEHTGDGGGEKTTTAALGDFGDNSVVDWVFVEIRSGIKLDSIISTRSALLQKDGDVRDSRPAGDSLKADADGYAYLTFDSTLAGEYYVSVRHRNHLGVMTSEAGLLSPLVTRIDFTDMNTNALGIHPMKVNLDSTEQFMWAGDVTSDRRVIYQGPGNDVDEMFFRVIADPGNVDQLDNYIVDGYYRTDYNLDGNTIFQGPNNDRQMLIFNSILQFPDNQRKFLANYVILEQLP